MTEPVSDTSADRPDAVGSEAAPPLNWRVRVLVKACTWVMIAGWLVALGHRLGPACMVFSLSFSALLVYWILRKLCFLACPWLSAKAKATVHLAAVAVVVAVGVSIAWWVTSPKQMFRKVLADPVPDSVVIHQAEYQGAFQDYAIYLHFTIASKDLPRLLQKYPLEEIDKRPEEAVRFGAPPWWKPASLSEPRGYHKRGGTRVVKFWTNASRTEVYFMYWAL